MTLLQLIDVQTTAVTCQIVQSSPNMVAVLGTHMIGPEIDLFRKIFLHRVQDQSRRSAHAFRTNLRQMRDSPPAVINAVGIIGTHQRRSCLRPGIFRRRGGALAHSVKKTKRVRVEGTDDRFEIQYVQSIVDVAGGRAKKPGLSGWIDPDRLEVLDIGNNKFKRLTDGAILIAEER